ncbi:MAG: hypothetical protein CVU97_05730 [Firmicutes bacterium HGW-Firmicutes-21]|nr:MAG: hypothetical protein CVU97_05730 [Firmicutes bacterium HGW-Firmicutes-21]
MKDCLLNVSIQTIIHQFAFVVNSFLDKFFIENHIQMWYYNNIWYYLVNKIQIYRLIIAKRKVWS